MPDCPHIIDTMDSVIVKTRQPVYLRYRYGSCAHGDTFMCQKPQGVHKMLKVLTQAHIGARLIIHNATSIVDVYIPYVSNNCEDAR